MDRVEPTAHNEPDPRGGRDPRQRSEQSDRGARREPESIDRRQSTDADPDPVMSGADAVEKSTYVGDVHGADVGDREARGVPVTASVPSGGGASPIAWIAAILAILALLAYAVGLFV